MLDRLIDVLLEIVGWFKFWYVLDPWDHAVRVRLGRHVQTLTKPGLYWMWPFNIDRIINIVVVLRTMTGTPQKLTTKDGVTVEVVPLVRYRIRGAAEVIIDLDEEEVVLRDTLGGAVRDVVTGKTWAELYSDRSAEGEALRRLRDQLNQYGFKCERVTFVRLARTISVTL